MSAIALLPDDLLSDILCLGAAFDIPLKFAVALVSSHWRHVALTSPLLWACIHLTTGWDCSRLKLVLERCGPSAPLDIYLSGPSNHTTNAALPELELAMRALQSYAARIRVLNTSVSSDALLNSQLYFPMLHTLHVRKTRDALAHNIRQTAPNLRVLAVSTGAWIPVRLEDLLSIRLEEVHLYSHAYYHNLLLVFAHCRRLVHLTFRSNERDLPDGRHGREAVIPTLLRLQTLDLRFPIPLLIKVLDNVVHRDTVLSVATVSFPYVSNDITLLFHALLRRMGRITLFSMENETSITLHDDVGRQRTIAMWSGVSSLGSLWPHIGEVHRAHETIRRITIPLVLWDALVDALLQHPPGAVSSLRLLISRTKVDNSKNQIAECGGRLPPMRQLEFPRLERIELGVMKTITVTRRLPALLVVHILQGITCDATRILAVDIDAEIAEVEETRDVLQRMGGGRWQLVNRV